MRLWLTSRLRIASPLAWCSRVLAIGLVFATISPAMLLAQDYEGFLEPFRRVDIASLEAGIVDKIEVKEGDLVTANQIVAELNCDVLIATLRAAEKARDSRGRLNAATVEIQDRTRMLEKLTALREKGHSSQQEIDQAELKKVIAEAQLQIVQDELAVRSLEAKRIEAEIERRRLRSPIDGIVVEITKDPGELVSMNDAQVLTIVQLDPLICVFPINFTHARNMQAGQKVKVQVGEAVVLEGTVAFRSPLVDPQTGTTKIKVLVPNLDKKLASGDRCQLLVDGKPKVTAAANDSTSPGNPKPLEANGADTRPAGTNIFGQKTAIPSPKTTRPK
jgi:RND family efflux transporter MFP subunit